MNKIIKSKFNDKIQYHFVGFDDKYVIFKTDFSGFSGNLEEAVSSETIAIFNIKEEDKAGKFFDSI